MLDAGGPGAVIVSGAAMRGAGAPGEGDGGGCCGAGGANGPAGACEVAAMGAAGKG